MVNTINSYVEAEVALHAAPALIGGAPPPQPPPPPPPVVVTATAPSPPVIVADVAPPPPVIEEAPAPSDSVLDALYADISAYSEEIDFSPDELESAVQEMEEDYRHDEQA